MKLFKTRLCRCEIHSQINFGRANEFAPTSHSTETIKMKKYFFLLLLAATTAHAAPFADGNAANGKILFAKYECSSCHQGKMGGDGSAIFTRPDHMVRDASALIPRIKFCSGVVGAKLTAQEEQDLAAHLNQTYYHFK